jgi:Mannosylglycerate hydrolase MGH1-like glycoside hydrolase domain
VSDAEHLAALSRGVLSSSWAEGERRGVPYAYTRPSPSRYPWQWYWDSCFAAISWRRFDATRSRVELETLLRAMRDDGFIGHVVFWDRPISLRRRLYYNVASRTAEMTGTIQPPLLAWAWSIAIGDPRAEPAIARHHEWLVANRDLEGDGLLWLVQPDESGLDSSPKFDPVWGYRSHANWGFPLLVARNRRLGWDARRIRDRGWPVICEVMTNVLWGLARLARNEASITPALVDRLWDERRGLFLDAVQPGGAGPPVSTWAALSPLALPDLPEEIGRRLVEEHLLDERRYWLPVPPSSVSAAEPSFEPDRGPGWKRRYWRGPTWVNAAWLLWLGLVRLGYDAEAEHMAGRLGGTILREGLREYYDPFTGQGLGATDFAWTSLICELADRVPDAASSYLELSGAAGRVERPR